MNDKTLNRVGKNILPGLLMGACVFFAGLFITLASWGLYSFLGVPMMLFALALPFLQARLASKGKRWTGAEKKKHHAGTMGRDEAENFKNSLRREQRTSKVS